MPRSLQEFGVSTEDLPSVIRGLRGVAQVSIVADETEVLIHVLTQREISEQTHWVELLQRTVELLASSTYDQPVHVLLQPDDADLDASFHQ